MARVDDVRAARMLFQRALAAGISLDEARRRAAQARWEKADSRLAARRAGESDEGDARLAWWQR